MKSAWKILLSLMFVFLVTFIIFPGAFFDSHLNEMKNIGSNEFTWYSLTIILIFNVLDTVGRKLGGVFMVSSELTYILSFLRIVFVFTTIFIAKLDNKSDRFMENDGFKIINVVLFALTNGYVSTLCAIKAPSFVAEN